MKMVVDVMLNQKIALLSVADRLAPVDEFPLIVRPVIPIITIVEKVAVGDDLDFQIDETVKKLLIPREREVRDWLRRGIGGRGEHPFETVTVFYLHR